MHYEVVPGLYLLLDVSPPATDTLKSFWVWLPGGHDAERSAAQTESLIPDNISSLSALVPFIFPFLFSFSLSSSLAFPKPFSRLTFLINNDFLCSGWWWWGWGGAAMKR